MPNTSTSDLKPMKRRSYIKNPGATLSSLLENISAAYSADLVCPIKLRLATAARSREIRGGTTSLIVIDENDKKYFIKTRNLTSNENIGLLQQEYISAQEIANTNTIKTPTPLAYGNTADNRKSFAIYEYMNVGYKPNQRELGHQLAKLHRQSSPCSKFGFHIDNSILSTPQCNQPWENSWGNFWDSNRLCPMLQLTHNCCGLSSLDVHILRSRTRFLLSSHQPSSSLLHGDLSGTNVGYGKVENSKTGEVTTRPVIFDPSTYYGDREVDLAISELFGGFTSEFYRGYNEEWPIPQDYDQRKVVYQLYHIYYCDKAKKLIFQIMPTEAPVPLLSPLLQNSPQIFSRLDSREKDELFQDEEFETDFLQIVRKRIRDGDFYEV